jgi:hypothetical protein
MKNKKIIFAITFVAFAMSSPPSPGGSPLAPDPTAERTVNIGTTQMKPQLLMAAENKQDAVQSQTQTATDKKDQTSGSGSENAANSGKNSDNAAAKPFKPFVPSEKIPADQAVDFPADI